VILSIIPTTSSMSNACDLFSSITISKSSRFLPSYSALIYIKGKFLPTIFFATLQISLVIKYHKERFKLVIKTINTHILVRKYIPASHSWLPFLQFTYLAA